MAAPRCELLELTLQLQTVASIKSLALEVMPILVVPKRNKTALIEFVVDFAKQPQHHDVVCDALCRRLSARSLVNAILSYCPGRNPGRKKIDICSVFKGVNRNGRFDGVPNKHRIEPPSASNVPCEPALVPHVNHAQERLRKRLHRSWIKAAARLSLRQKLSRDIRNELKLAAADPSLTIAQIRMIVSERVGISMETGQAYIFFQRSIQKLFPKTRAKRKRKHREHQKLSYACLAPSAYVRGCPLNEFRERGCMTREDQFSWALR